MRKDLGFPDNVSILEYVDTLEESAKERANKIILEHKLTGAHQSKLTQGAFDLLSFLYEKKVPMAIQTRNCKEVTDIIIDKLSIPIEIILTRENSIPKPDPSGVYQIAHSWEIQPNEILYVGDSHFDLTTSINANSDFALFSNSRNESHKIKHDLTIKCLSELKSFF
jgi:HAD superfamily hydrolase (TIGR01549 family)